MEFSIKEWRKIYDKVHGFGRILRDSRPTYDYEGKVVAPKHALSEKAQIKLELQIKKWIDYSTHYMNQCGIKSPKPLWYCDRANPATHLSSKEFKYGHLL